MEWNMDNDNKIEMETTSPEQRHKEVLLFLNDELNRLQVSNSQNSYDLEKEYAKTKKNKSPFTFLLLFLSAVVVFFAAWGITSYIDKQNEEITVNLKEFEELNVKELLDSVSKVQNNYNEALKNKTNLVADKEMALKKAEEQKSSDLFLLESLTLSSKEQTKRKTAIEEEYENTVAAISEQYDQQILLAELELDEYKKQLEEYDAAKVQAAREHEQALDSQRRLQEMEKERISKEYENRIALLQEEMATERKNNTEQLRRAVTEVSNQYLLEIDKLDPTFKNESEITLVEKLLAEIAAEAQLEAEKQAAEQEEALESETEEKLEDEDKASFALKAFENEKLLQDETIAQGLTEYNEIYENYTLLREPIEKIPHKHSVPSYLQAIKKLVDNMGGVFAQTSEKLYGEKDELNKNISALTKDINNLNYQIEKIKKENAAEKEKMEKDFADEKAKLRSEFNQEKEVLASDYVNIYEGILTSAKANAVIISAHSPENIRIYVVPQISEKITETGATAEIKAEKSIKGKIIPIPEEPGFYNFENALDKAGNPIEYDFSTIAPGQIVKVTVPKN